MTIKNSWTHNVAIASIVLLFSYVLYPNAYTTKPFVELFSKVFENLRDDSICERPSYTVRMLSHDPLMMHIEDFITPKERQHLLRVAAPLSKRSTVLERNGTKLLSSTRTSSSAYIPKDDPISRCISQRAAEFQGYEALDNIERLQVTSYSQTQEYKTHFDWYGRSMNTTTDRATTIFGILEADCDNCGTSFPRLPVEWETQDERWCRIVDCNSPFLVVNPLPGAALFWRNLNDDGSGDRRMAHAGLPLTRGFKTGLNIWTKQEVYRQ